MSCLHGMGVAVRFRDLPIDVFVKYKWIGVAACGEVGKGRTCQFSPAIRASSRSSIFSRFLALLKVALLTIQRNHKGTKGGEGYRSKSLIHFSFSLSVP